MTRWCDRSGMRYARWRHPYLPGARSALRSTSRSAEAAGDPRQVGRGAGALPGLAGRRRLRHGWEADSGYRLWLIAKTRSSSFPGTTHLLSRITGFECKPSVQANGTLQLRVTRSAFGRFLHALGVAEGRAPDKVVPEAIYRSTRRCADRLPAGPVRRGRLRREPRKQRDAICRAGQPLGRTPHRCPGTPGLARHRLAHLPDQRRRRRRRSTTPVRTAPRRTTVPMGLRMT